MLTIETFLPLKRLIIKQKMLMTKTMILSLLLLLFPAMQATAANKKALHVHSGGSRPAGRDKWLMDGWFYLLG